MIVSVLCVSVLFLTVAVADDFASLVQTFAVEFDTVLVSLLCRSLVTRRTQPLTMLFLQIHRANLFGLSFFPLFLRESVIMRTIVNY